MSTTIKVEQRLLDKICKLSSEKIVEVEDFIDFLYQQQTDSDKNLTLVATQLSEVSFSKVQDNPEDAEHNKLNLERDAKRPSLMA